MSTAQRYPLSTATGSPIPLDVVKPLALIIVPYSTASTPYTVTIPEIYKDKLLLLSSTAPCLISTNGGFPAIAENTVLTGVLLLQDYSEMVIVANSLSIAVMGYKTNVGTLTIQVLDTWSIVALESQLNRR